MENMSKILYISLSYIYQWSSYFLRMQAIQLSSILTHANVLFFCLTLLHHWPFGPHSLTKHDGINAVIKLVFYVKVTPPWTIRLVLVEIRVALLPSFHMTLFIRYYFSICIYKQMYTEAIKMYIIIYNHKLPYTSMSAHVSVHLTRQSTFMYVKAHSKWS